jgi:hypothetical protein
MHFLTMSVDSRLRGALAVHLVVDSAELLQFAQVLPSANPDANYISRTAFANYQFRPKEDFREELPFCFPAGLRG